MRTNLERVISVVDENSVIDGATILHTTYDRGGYRISHISMGKGTYVAPERFRSPTLIYVRKGQLRIASINKKNKYDVIVKEGQEHFRQGKEYAGYFADDSDVIFTEVVMRPDTEVSMRLIPHQVQDYIHLVHYEPGQASLVHLVNDEFFQMNLIAYSESDRKEFRTEKPVILNCLEGRVTILHGDKQFVLHHGDSFILPAKYACTVCLASRTKVWVLHLADDTKLRGKDLW